MSYRFEKNANGEQDLVIDGFEKGIATSPYKGIANLRNVTIKFYEGVAYVNYKRKSCTVQNSAGVSTGTVTISNASPAVLTLNSHGLLNTNTVTLTTTGTLPTGLSTGVTYYVVNQAANTFELSLTRGGSSINTSSAGSGVHTFTVVIGKPQYSTQSPAGIIYISDDNRTIWKQTAVNGSTFKILSGSNASTDIGGISFWMNYLFTFGAGSGSNGRIEVCGDGSGDAGVTSSNWNNTQPTATFTVTIAAASGTCTISNASPCVVTKNSHGLSANDPVRFTTSGVLPSPLDVSTIYFVSSSGLSSNDFEIATTPGGTVINTTTVGSGTYTLVPIAVFTSNGHGLDGGDRIRLSTTGALPTGLSTSIDYFVLVNNVTANTFMVSLSSNEGAAIHTSGSQSGTQTLTYLRGVWPIQSGITITVSTLPAAGDTTTTGFSYTDGGGTSRDFWNSPSGYYPLSIVTASTGGSQLVTAYFTQGSSTITWTPALNADATSASAPLLTNGGDSTVTLAHTSLIAANTGNLYWCNGPYIAALIRSLNQTVNKSDMSTFTFYANILSLPPTELTTSISEIRNLLVVTGRKTIYNWDFTSPDWNNPIPMDELITRSINILNTLYIFAGNKGNIYVSNGYSISRFNKLPDYIAGVIDPAWTIGGRMTHRQKLFFQATATNSQTGTLISSGTFSLDLDNAALNMENQNSAGLTPTGSSGVGVLIDNPSVALNYDNYYSAFGADVSYIDYNDTTLYSNNEPMVESDIIPIGTFAQSKTFSNAEFKMDQPMQSGDSITLYARASLSDSYTLVGTTTSALLSDLYSPLPFQKWQWVQFKATMSCNATAFSSSFNRLREIRIR